MNILTRLSLTMGLCLSFFSQAQTINLSGEIRLNTDTKVAGAMVSLTDANGVSQTVYSDEDGKWALTATNLAKPISLRVRSGPGYADETLDQASNLSSPVNIELTQLLQPQDISAQLTASAHAASIRWKSAKTKVDFVSQCHFCHQMGNEFTRRPRTEDEWKDVIDRMQGYGALITWKNEAEFAQTLSKEFDGKPVKNVQTLAMHPDLPKAKMYEWAFGGPVNYVHDIEQGSDGKLYGVDMSDDKIWILNLNTNEIEEVHLPPNDLPLGGDFAGAVAPLGTFAAYHGPHSIVEGPDGKMYLTCSLSSEIGIFDPKTKQFEFIALDDHVIYPHTLRFDKQGTLWFTLALSNQIGRMDINSKEITIIELPSNGFWRWVSDLMLPNILKVAAWFGKKDMHVKLSHHKLTGEGRDILNLPYGIDINPIDGSIWYSKLYAGYIGRVDPKTLKVEEFKTPYKSPRRLRFDAQGTLWIPSFEEGVLSKFNAQTKTFVKHYKLPLLAENEYETPYALAIHPQTQQVWIAANMSDRILRFNPKDESFVAYPSPTRVTFLRDFIFTPQGDVCTSNANLPSGAIEGGRPKIMCLTPDVQHNLQLVGKESL